MRSRMEESSTAPIKSWNSLTKKNRPKFFRDFIFFIQGVNLAGFTTHSGAKLSENARAQFISYRHQSWQWKSWIGKESENTLLREQNISGPALSGSLDKSHDDEIWSLICIVKTTNCPEFTSILQFLENFCKFWLIGKNWVAEFLQIGLRVYPSPKLKRYSNKVQCSHKIQHRQSMLAKTMSKFLGISKPSTYVVM